MSSASNLVIAGLDPAIHPLQREKNIKRWSREWKIDLIVADNPDWRNLYDEIVR